jgi:transcriptional regulator with XRE-family HTH domain
LPNSQRRRTPGLRREEVAQLAGVSPTWYTRLEQANDIHVSTDVLNSVANALRLNLDERAYLFGLGQDIPRPPTSNMEAVSSAVHAILDDLATCPAMVLGWRWDILAWNRAASTVYTDFSAIPPDTRNYISWLYMHPSARQLLVDWETHAQSVLARFRASYGRHVGDPTFTALIDMLCAQSEAFKQWWARHDVTTVGEWNKEIQHPLVGKLELEHVVLEMAGDPDVQVIVQPPLTAEAAERLRWLASHIPAT